MTSVEQQLSCSDCGEPLARKTPTGYCNVCKNRHSRDAPENQLYGAKKRDGSTCRAFAGFATDHVGIGPCKYHGGSTRNHRKHAVIVKAQQDAVTLGAPLNVTPDQALQGALRASAGHTAWLATEVAGLDGVTGVEAATLVRLYGEERDRLARVAKTCMESGMARREVEFQQETADTLAAAIDSAFKAVEGITSEQRKEFGKTLRLELQRLAAPLEAEPVG